MMNVEITEERLIQHGWSKVGNTFYRNKKAVTHFDGKFQVWSDGSYHVVKTISEIHVLTEGTDTKKA